MSFAKMCSKRFDLRATPRVLLAAGVVTLAACSSTGGLGNILGSVLGGAPQQVSGDVQGVDPRAQQISIRQANGQTVQVAYDNNTKVVYQNQNYSPASLERGDNVTASLQDNGNGAYYTSQVLVNQSVRNTGTGTSSNAQSFQGTVRQIDRANGVFTVDDGNVGRITVTLPNNMSRADIDRYNGFRSGDVVRFSGYNTGNGQVQLQQFY